MDTITARITERLREELKLEAHRGGVRYPSARGPRVPGAQEPG